MAYGVTLSLTTRQACSTPEDIEAEPVNTDVSSSCLGESGLLSSGAVGVCPTLIKYSENSSKTSPKDYLPKTKSQLDVPSYFHEDGPRSSRLAVNTSEPTLSNASVSTSATLHALDITECPKDLYPAPTLASTLHLQLSPPTITTQAGGGLVFKPPVIRGSKSLPNTPLKQSSNRTQDNNSDEMCQQCQPGTANSESTSSQDKQVRSSHNRTRKKSTNNKVHSSGTLVSRDGIKRRKQPITTWSSGISTTGGDVVTSDEEGYLEACELNSFKSGYNSNLQTYANTANFYLGDNVEQTASAPVSEMQVLAGSGDPSCDDNNSHSPMQNKTNTCEGDPLYELNKCSSYTNKINELCSYIVRKTSSGPKLFQTSSPTSESYSVENFSEPFMQRQCRSSSTITAQRTSLGEGKKDAATPTKKADKKIKNRSLSLKMEDMSRSFHEVVEKSIASPKAWRKSKLGEALFGPKEKKSAFLSDSEDEMGNEQSISVSYQLPERKSTECINDHPDYFLVSLQGNALTESKYRLLPATTSTTTNMEKSWKFPASIAREGNFDQIFKRSYTTPAIYRGDDSPNYSTLHHQRVSDKPSDVSTPSLSSCTAVARCNIDTIIPLVNNDSTRKPLKDRRTLRVVCKGSTSDNVSHVPEDIAPDDKVTVTQCKLTIAQCVAHCSLVGDQRGAQDDEVRHFSPYDNADTFEKTRVTVDNKACSRCVDTSAHEKAFSIKKCRRSSFAAFRTINTPDVCAETCVPDEEVCELTVTTTSNATSSTDDLQQQHPPPSQ